MSSLHVLQITDPHLYSDGGCRLYGVTTAEALRLVLAEALLSGPRPDAIVVTGDIGDDLSAGAYLRFRELLTVASCPVFCLPGNHDDPALMARLLDESPFQYCGQVRLRGWGMVFLDTHVPGEAFGRLRDAELVRLEGALHEMSDAPVLVALHHPPVPVGSAWLDAVGLVNAQAFFEILDRHPNVRAVIAGHVHQDFELRHGSVPVFASPATCAQFLPRTVGCVMDSRPPGYRWLELTDQGGLATRVSWLAGSLPATGQSTAAIGRGGARDP